MTQISDQVIPALAKDFGAAKQVDSGQVAPNIQATAAVEDYRRVLRSTRESTIMTGATAALTLTYEADDEEVRQYFLINVRVQLAATLGVVGTIQRGTSARLLMEVIRGSITANQRIVIVGRYERAGLAAFVQSFPDEVIQPNDSTFVLKFTNNAGGNIPAGTIHIESSYWRKPPLRRWGGGAPDSIVQA